MDFNTGPSDKTWYVDPVDFCLAVINGDVEVLARCGLDKLPNISARIEAARIAIPYTNKKKPVETVSKHQFSWHDEISEAEQRVANLRRDEDGIGDYDSATNTVN